MTQFCAAQRPLRSTEAASSPAKNELTQLLRSWARGDSASQERLFEMVYPRLRKMAAAKLHGEPNAPSLHPTELANEVYLRLVNQSHVDWQSRAHFLALSATLIRRILLDRAKSRSRIKRGDGAVRVSLDQVELVAAGQDVDLLALDQALVELARFQPTSARIVELRFFGGQNVEETAAVLGLGSATVVRKWRFAKARLAERLDSRE